MSENWNTTANKKVGSINYWLFQANPKTYDYASALSKGLPIKWRVMAHKDKIHPQDKVILWICGAKAGCYALCEVTSEVIPTTSDYWEKGFIEINPNEQPGYMVEITIIHNLLRRPLLKYRLNGISELKDLKAGCQGTNFSATAEQYNALEKLAEAKVPQT